MALIIDSAMLGTLSVLFFFQAEDGIRDADVTGVQTCALPILEIETSSTVGVPRAGQHWFFAPYLELEYGVTGRWTSELYLEGQSTAGDSAIFTGWRIENRFRPLAREHWINPVLYLEYENINEASRIRKEIVGAAPELNESNAELRATRAHELETRLILSSTAHNWNISENFIVEKNLSENEGFEFGYAL